MLSPAEIDSEIESDLAIAILRKLPDRVLVSAVDIAAEVARAIKSGEIRHTQRVPYRD